MKLSRSIQISSLLLVILGILAVACNKKDDYLGYKPGTGAPTITAVHTLGKTLHDTLVTEIKSYDSSGELTSRSDTNANHVSVVPFDSVTTAGNKGDYYVIHGTNLGDATTVSFNGISAYFNRSLSTDQTIVVQIPNNVPTSGPQATDTLRIVTLHGTVNYHFVVVSPPPTIAQASDYNFWGGSQITLTGTGFAAVTSVGIAGGDAQIDIVSQADSQIVLHFNTTDVNRGNLIFNYDAGGTPAMVKSSQEFVNLDNAYTIVFKDQFQNAWADNSWSGPAGISSDATHSSGGTSSAKVTYPAGGWKIEGWANWYPSFPYDASYKYLTFWVKGGVANHTLILVGDQVPGGYSQNTSSLPVQQILVPKGVWTYYKIPLGSASGQLNYWANGNVAQQLGFFLQGQNGDVDETMFFDEVAFVK